MVKLIGEVKTGQAARGSPRPATLNTSMRTYTHTHLGIIHTHTTMKAQSNMMKNKGYSLQQNNANKNRPNKMRKELSSAPKQLRLN